MEAIDAALSSLEDSLDRLASRLRGTEGEALQLFRGRISLDETQALVAQARANGAIGGGWGAAFLQELSDATLLVAAAPARGGEPFQRAMEAVGDALASVQGALP